MAISPKNQEQETNTIIDRVNTRFEEEEGERQPEGIDPTRVEPDHYLIGS